MATRGTGGNEACLKIIDLVLGLSLFASFTYLFAKSRWQWYRGESTGSVYGHAFECVSTTLSDLMYKMRLITPSASPGWWKVRIQEEVPATYSAHVGLDKGDRAILLWELDSLSAPFHHNHFDCSFILTCVGFHLLGTGSRGARPLLSRLAASVFCMMNSACDSECQILPLKINWCSTETPGHVCALGRYSPVSFK